MGLTSLRLGSMEWGNLGNYTIVQPLLSLLRQELPHAEIRTTLQLSREVCEEYDLVSLTGKRFWRYRWRTTVVTAATLLAVALLGLVHEALRGLLVSKFGRRSSLLRELLAADLVLDFSGDRYGDNVKLVAFIEGSCRLLIAHLLGKQTAMIFSSPGPFRGRTRRLIARAVLTRVTHCINREDASTRLVDAITDRRADCWTAGCPSFLFESSTSEAVKHEIFRREGLLESGKPIVGLILCDLNMLEGELDSVPRSKRDLVPYRLLIQHLVTVLGLRVCLMSHENDFDAERCPPVLFPGTDHLILTQLLGSVRELANSGDVFMLQDCYSAEESRDIISRFSMLVSGRIHGAVQGMSQGIPTVVIDYGLGPPAHKLRGIADLVGQEGSVCRPEDPTQLVNVATHVWRNRASIQKELLARSGAVRETVRRAVRSVAGNTGT